MGVDGKPGDSGAVEHFGKELIDKGYHHLGANLCTVGLAAKYLQADMYMGVVYYQVSD